MKNKGKVISIAICVTLLQGQIAGANFTKINYAEGIKTEIRREKEDSKEESTKEDSKDESGKEDSKDESGKEDSKDESGKEDSKDESGKEDSEDEKPGDGEKPGETEDEEPGDGEKPGETEDEEPGDGEKPGETEDEEPGDGEKPGETEDEEPGDGEKPGETEDEEPGDGEKPGETEDEKPGDGEKPGETEDEEPGDGEKPGETEDEEPGDGEKPGETEDEEPGDGEKPGETEDEEPGDGEKPGETEDEELGDGMPGQAPQEPEEIPEEDIEEDLKKLQDAKAKLAKKIKELEDMVKELENDDEGKKLIETGKAILEKSGNSLEEYNEIINSIEEFMDNLISSKEEESIFTIDLKGLELRKGYSNPKLQKLDNTKVKLEINIEKLEETMREIENNIESVLENNDKGWEYLEFAGWNKKIEDLKETGEIEANVTKSDIDRLIINLIDLDDNLVLETSSEFEISKDRLETEPEIESFILDKDPSIKIDLDQTYKIEDFMDYLIVEDSSLILGVLPVYKDLYRINIDIENKDRLEVKKLVDNKEEVSLFAKENEEVKLSIKPSFGFSIKSVEIRGKRGKELDLEVEDTIYSFKMPGEDISIGVELDIAKEISLKANGGKFILEDTEEAKELVLSLEEYTKVSDLKDISVVRDMEVSENSIKTYKFMGWSPEIDGETLEDNEGLQGIEELYAIWKEEDTQVSDVLENIIVKFHKNISKNLLDGSEIPEDQKIEKDEDGNYKILRPEDLKVESGECEDYNFQGWSIYKDKLSDEDDIFWNFEEDDLADYIDYIEEENGSFVLNLYGQWKVIDLMDLATDKNNPFEIKSKDALKTLAKNVNKGNPYKDRYFVIADNIDLENEEWNSIGNEKNPFSGNIWANEVSYSNIEDNNKDEDNSEETVKEDKILDSGGKGPGLREDNEDEEDIDYEETNKSEIENNEKYYKIIGLKISNGKDYAGLFGHIKGGKIENLVVEGEIKAKNYVGGLVGYLGSDSSVSNIVVDVKVDAEENVGGLVGGSSENVKIFEIENRGKIKGKTNVGVIGSLGDSNIVENISNKNTVIGGANIGGIIGRAGQASNLSSLNNSGKVEGKENTGAILGQGLNKLEVSSSKNEGEVKGGENTGGIIGFIGEKSSLRDLENSGPVEGTLAVGGILGRGLEDLKLYDLENKANILGLGKVGGILGDVKLGLSLKKSNNQARVESTEDGSGWKEKENKRAGGLVGSIEAFKEIKDSYNTGEVKSKGFSGGIVGYANLNSFEVSKILDSYNEGRVIGENVGGILSTDTGSRLNIEKTYNLGKLEATGNLGGIVSFLPKASQVKDSYNAGSLNGGKNIGGIAGETYYKDSHVEVNSTFIESSFNYGIEDIVGSGYTGKNINNFKLQGYVGESSEQGTMAKTKEDFKNGVVATLLDIKENGGRKFIWGQGSKYPILSSSDVKPIYKIEVEINGGENGLVKGLKDYAAGNEELVLDIQPKEGYILEILEVTDKKDNYYDIEIDGSKYKFTMQEEDIKIYISFIEKPIEAEFEVKFLVDGEEYDKQKISAGKQVKRPDNPLALDYGKEGMEFDKWILGDRPYNFTAAVLKDLELEASWKSSEEVLVKFDLNEDFLNLKENLENPESSDQINNRPEEALLKIETMEDDDGNITKIFPKLNKPLDPEVIKNSNRLLQYELKGWFTEKTGGEEWDFNEEIKNNMTLFAHWEEKRDIPDGFIFKTVEELKVLAKSVNSGNTHEGKTFYLGNDIDLNDSEDLWEAIGYHKHINAPNQKRDKKIEPDTIAFDGTLDGENYKIILQSDQLYPFIGAIGKNSVIRNINIYGDMSPRPERKSFGGLIGYSYGLIENVNIELDQKNKNEISFGQTSAGLVAGNYGDIKNVKVKAYMVSENDGQVYLGGLAGVSQPGVIENVVILSGSKFKFTAKGGWGAPMGFVGGAIGAMFGKASENDSINDVIIEDGVEIEGNGTQVGGVTGQSVGKIINCYNGSNLNISEGAVGGITGYDGGGTSIERCINKGTITAKRGNGWVAGIGGIAGGKISSIKDSYSLGEVIAIDGDVAAGISSNTENISNSYFYGNLIGVKKLGVSDNSESIKNVYYGSEDEEVTDPNDNPNMNKNDIDAELDYTGSKKATREQLSNGEVAYYLNNIDGIQRENLLWGVDPDTKLPVFGGIYYVRVAVGEIDSSKGTVTLIDKETEEEIILEGKKYSFIKKDHPYEVKIETIAQDKDEEGNELGYGFDELEIIIGQGTPNEEIINLKDKFNKEEDLIVEKDGVTNIEYEEEMTQINKKPEKPILPGYPEDNDYSDEDKDGGENPGGGSGSGSGSGSGNGTGSGGDSGSGSGKLGYGDGQLGFGQGDEGTEEGNGEETTVEVVNEESERQGSSPRGDGSESKEISQEENDKLVAVNVQDIKDRQLEDLVTTDDKAKDKEDEDLSKEEAEEKEEDTDSEVSEKKDTEEETDEMEEEQKISFVEKVTEKIKENKMLAVIIAIGFVGLNILVAALRFFLKKKKK